MNRLLFILLSATILLGLGHSALAQQPLNTSEIRVINALVGFGPVDIYLNGTPIAYNQTAEQATPYFVVPPGQHRVAVRGAGDDALSAPIADILLNVAPGQSQSAIAYQRVFPTEGYTPPINQSATFMVLDDNRSATMLGKARVTAVHLALGTPGRISVAYPDRASLLHEISLETPHGSIDINAGVYPLTLVDADSPQLSRIELIGDVSLFANTLYTLVIVPDLVPPANPNQVVGLSAGARMFIVSAPLDPPTDGLRVRLIHAAHNTQIVDVYIDERLVAPRFNYSRATEYLPLESYSHIITLRARDAAPNAPPLAVARMTIDAESRNQKNWSLLLLNANQANTGGLERIDQPQQLINTEGGSVILQLLPDDMSQTPVDTVRVRLVHAVDGAIEIGLRTPLLPLLPGEEPVPTAANAPAPPPVQLIEPVIYGAEANQGETREGVYEELQFIVGGSSVITRLLNQPLIDGLVYTFVLIGQPAGEPPVSVLTFAEYGRGLPQERLFRGTIISNQPVVNVRAQASLGSNTIARLPNGFEAEVLGRNFNGEWINIRFNDPDSGRLTTGWVSAPLINVTRLGVPINVLSLPLIAR